MSEKMKVAIVTGIFTIIVAVIGGLFHVGSALIEGGIIITGPGVQVGNPQAEEMAQITPVSRYSQEPITGSGSLPTPTQQVPECYGDWESCWRYNDSAQTMTWIGLQNGAVDIGQNGTALDKIQSGYTAIFTIETSMKIHICVGTINNEALPGECPNVLTLSPGTYRIKSPGSSGGFRVYQQ